MKKSKNRYIFLSSKKIDLCVPNSDRHLDNITRWMNDSKITKYLIRGNMPFSLASEAKWIERTNESETDIILAIETKRGRHIGIIGLHDINWPNRRAELGICIGESEYWGQGIATEAEALIIKHGFNIGLEKITISFFEENKPSIKAATKNGFQQEGLLRKHFYKNGNYHNLVIGSILKENWINLK